MYCKGMHDSELQSEGEMYSKVNKARNKTKREMYSKKLKENCTLRQTKLKEMYSEANKSRSKAEREMYSKGNKAKRNVLYGKQN